MPTVTRMHVAHLILSLSVVGFSSAAEKTEHQRLAQRALDDVLLECHASQSDSGICLMTTAQDCFPILLLNSMSFAELSSFFSDDDIVPTRFQERGRTIKEQLEWLAKSDVDATLQASLSVSLAQSAGSQLLERVKQIERSKQSVVGNYLMPHLVALHNASEAGKDANQRRERLRLAFIYEARAQSYLIDAFCAGHLLVPIHDGLHWLHPTNNKVAHDFYNTKEGVYVINSQHDAWQAFGDGLLEWYSPSYEHALEACRASLREILLTFFVSKDETRLPDNLRRWAMETSGGIGLAEMVNRWLSAEDGTWYYETAILPTLLQLPMPVSAAWSVRGEQVDTHGIHQRRVYPQLREARRHDQDMDGIDPEFLYASESLPSWMRFTPTSSPDSLVRSNPAVASVRYIQQRDFPASNVGFLLHGRVGHDFTAERQSVSLGVGYGWTNDFLFLILFKNVSTDIVVMRSLSDVASWFISGTGGITAAVPHFGIMGGTRCEAGYMWGLGQASGSRGAMLAAGLEASPIPLQFTYAGLTLRIMYRWLGTSPHSHTVSLDVVVQ